MRYKLNGIIYNKVATITLNDRYIINPSHEQILAAGYEVVDDINKDSKTLDEWKSIKISEIEAHDKSTNVNQFYFNGNPYWLDKATRSSIMDTIGYKRLLDQTEIEIWFSGLKFKFTLDQAVTLLSSIELYAFDCFNVTEMHKAAINEMTSIEEVMSYDYTLGYPNKLKLTWTL